MMAVVYLLLTLLAASQAYNCSEILKEAYLDLPTRDQLETGLHQEISKALLKLEIKSDMSDQAVTGALSQALRDEKTDPTDRKVYADVLAILERDSYCPQHMMEVYLSIWAQINSSPSNSLENLRDFLRNSGWKRFAICAAKENADFNKRTLPAMVNVLDKIFKQTFGFQNEVTLEKLYERLKSFDMTSYNLFGKQMIRAVKSYEPKYGYWDEDDLSLLERFMLEKCTELDAESRRVLNIFSLDRYFRYSTEYSTRLLTFIEYHRLCLAWEKPATVERIKGSIRKQLDKKPLWKKARNNLIKHLSA